MRTGKYAVYNGKEYLASLTRDKRQIELYSNDVEDADNGFKKDPYGGYSKRVRFKEVSEFYEINAEFDYMGKTHRPYFSANGEYFKIFVNDSSYKQYGFTEEYDMTYTNRCIGYQKEFKVSENPVRFIMTPIKLE